MTPDLLAQGAHRAGHHTAGPAQSNTASGGRQASGSRVVTPGEVDVTHGRILYLQDVSVSFDGFKAINKLSLDIAPGELRCIIGPNGAGKTTLMDIITGKTRPQEGTVFFGSTIDLLRHKESEIAQLGIGRKFQKPTVFEQLTVFENLELALKTSPGGERGVWASLFFKLDSRQSDRLADMLVTIHLAGSVHRLAGNLSHGQKQWLEIGMLLMQDPKLLLDEPVAGMMDKETARTAKLFLTLDETTERIQPSIIKDIGRVIRVLADRGDVAILLVEQYYDFAEALADDFLVMERGELIARGLGKDLQANRVRQLVAI